MNSSFRAERSGDPESSSLYSMCYGLFAALTLRAAPRAFNALRAFVPPSRESRKTGLISFPKQKGISPRLCWGGISTLTVTRVS